MGDFRRLVAWQKAHDYSIAVHEAFARIRVRASPGLRGQILRAANTIPDTLAEGCAKRSRAELARFADMAYASAKEVEGQLIKSRGLKILPQYKVDDLLRQGDKVAALCYGLAHPRNGPDGS